MVPKIDGYIAQELRAEPAEDALVEGAPMMAGGRVESGRIPMLVHVRRPDWNAQVDGLHIHSRVGTVLSCSGTAATVAQLEDDDGVVSVEASRPFSALDCRKSLPFVKADQVHAPMGETGGGALFAMIDSGIDVLHEAFLDANGRTRIHAIWDQRSTAGPAPSAAYGREHTHADIQGYLSSGNVPADLGRDPHKHGTHVASIAAGRAAGAFRGGMAPDARIVVVKSSLSTDPDDPSSIGYSHNHVDALAWVLEKARQLRLPVVLNVSQGMNAGAHDGTSLLEVAFDEFSAGGRAPGVVAVKSAGNERGHQGHSRVTMLSHSVDRFTWESDTRLRYKDVVEVWFRSCDELALSLENPSHDRTPWVSHASPNVNGSFPSGDRYDLDFVKLHHDNGDSRLLVRIQPGASFKIEPGQWMLHVESGRVQPPGEVHAWLERNDARPIRFTTHLDEEFSLSVPATARTVVAVGSISSDLPLNLAGFSSYGPTRDEREKPDLCAPGTSIEAADAGTSSGVRVMGGTSMAAPHVSGALCLLQSRWAKKNPGQRGLNAAQMRAALRNTAISFSGSWNRGMGFGALDAKALLDYFD